MGFGYSISDRYGLRVETGMHEDAVIEAIAIHTLINAGYDPENVFAFFGSPGIDYSMAIDCTSAVRIAELAFVEYWDRVMFGSNSLAKEEF